MKRPEPGGGGTTPQIDPKQQLTFADIPLVAQQMADQIAAGGAGGDPYTAALAEFGDLGVAEHYALNPELLKTPGATSASVTSASGKIRFANGVIVDQITGQLISGPWMADPEVEGSNAWLTAIQDEWTDAEFNTWRKRLLELGYVPEGGLAESGGKAMDIINALALYHQTRYINGGKVIPLTPVDVGTREAIREQVDFKSIKEGIKSSWGDAAFDKPLNDALATWLTEQIIKEATKLRRKHPTWTVGQAIGSPGSAETLPSGAFLRVQEEFTKMPEVKAGLREGERLEERTGLRERLETAARVYGSL